MEATAEENQLGETGPSKTMAMEATNMEMSSTTMTEASSRATTLPREDKETPTTRATSLTLDPELLLLSPGRTLP